MRKGNIKIYDLSLDGKYELKKEVGENNYVEKHNLSHLPSSPSNNIDIIMDNEDVISKEANDELYKNPFLYQSTPFTVRYISTVEDYYLNVNEGHYKFGEILRSNNFTKKEKRKYFNKQLKVWKKDTKNQINKIFKDSKENIKIGKKQNYVNVGGGNYFLLLLGLILPIVLLLNVIPTITFDKSLYKIIAIFLIVFSIFGLVLSFKQNKKHRNHKAKIAKHKRLHEKYFRKIKRSFEKSYLKLKKYYNKGYKNNSFKKVPLEISKVQIGMDKLNYIKKSSDDILKESQIIIKENEGFKLAYSIAILLSYVTPLVSGGYIVFMLLLNLYNKLIVKGE